MKSLVRPELAARWAALWQAGVSLARTCLLSPAAGKPAPRSAGLQGRAGAGAAPLTTPRGAVGPGRYRADVGANPGLSCRLALASASSCAPGPVRGTCGVIASLSPLARDCRPLGHLEGRGRGGVVAFPGHEPQLCIRALCPMLSPGCPRAPSCPLFCEDTTPMNCHWPSPGIHGDHSGHGHACPPAYPAAPRGQVSQAALKDLGHAGVVYLEQGGGPVCAEGHLAIAGYRAVVREPTK